MIDRIFVVTYTCDPARAARIDRAASLGLPALVLALLALCVVW